MLSGLLNCYVLYRDMVIPQKRIESIRQTKHEAALLDRSVDRLKQDGHSADEKLRYGHSVDKLGHGHSVDYCGVVRASTHCKQIMRSTNSRLDTWQTSSIEYRSVYVGITPCSLCLQVKTSLSARSSFGRITGTQPEHQKALSVDKLQSSYCIGDHVPFILLRISGTYCLPKVTILRFSTRPIYRVSSSIILY